MNHWSLVSQVYSVVFHPLIGSPYWRCWYSGLSSFKDYVSFRIGKSLTSYGEVRASCIAFGAYVPLLTVRVFFL
jgi:hypothetical protein